MVLIPNVKVLSCYFNYIFLYKDQPLFYSYIFNKNKILCYKEKLSGAYCSLFQ